MSNSGKDRKLLEKLGLSLVQSKVYISNLTIGLATAKQISQNARIAREEVYRVMPKLQNLGLVKRYLTKPTMFEAIPPKEAVKFLLNRRRQETEKISEEVKNFLGVWEKKNREAMVIEKQENTIWLSNPEANFRRVADECERAKHTVDGIINWETHKHVIVRTTELFKNAIERGVRVRLVMNKPHQRKFQLPKTTQHLFYHPSYKIRYISHPPKCRVAIFDDRIGSIIASSNVDASSSNSSIWSNNPILLCLIKEYFKKLWNSAKEIPHQELFC